MQCCFLGLGPRHPSNICKHSPRRCCSVGATRRCSRSHRCSQHWSDQHAPRCGSPRWCSLAGVTVALGCFYYVKHEATTWTSRRVLQLRCLAGEACKLHCGRGPPTARSLVVAVCSALMWEGGPCLELCLDVPKTHRWSLQCFWMSRSSQGREPSLLCPASAGVSEPRTNGPILESGHIRKYRGFNCLGVRSIA